MKTFLLAAFAFVLWFAVFGAGLRACDAEAAAREAQGRCLSAGKPMTYCMEVQP